MTLIRHLMNQFEAGLQKIELVTDHSEDYCRNYGRNIVDYVATLNYLSHFVVVLVLPGKRLFGKTSGYRLRSDPSEILAAPVATLNTMYCRIVTWSAILLPA